MNRNTDREESIRWAQERLADYRTIILDTETTGLSEDAEIVQIAVVDTQGNTLMNTLVKPTISIPRDAESIHGISNAQVASAPTFDLVYRDLYRIVEGRTLLIYNADYDMRLIFQSLAPYGLTGTELITSFREIQCAMAWYSQWIGEWSEWFGNYKWQRLPAGDHSALGDCIATLKVLYQMAGMEWHEPHGSSSASTANR
jgi:DNA polymerase-3 subunit epsilon